MKTVVGLSGSDLSPVEKILVKMLELNSHGIDFSSDFTKLSVLCTLKNALVAEQVARQAIANTSWFSNYVPEFLSSYVPNVGKYVPSAVGVYFKFRPLVHGVVQYICTNELDALKCGVLNTFLALQNTPAVNAFGINNPKNLAPLGSIKRPITLTEEIVKLRMPDGKKDKTLRGGIRNGTNAFFCKLFKPTIQKEKTLQAHRYSFRGTEARCLGSVYVKSYT